MQELRTNERNPLSVITSAARKSLSTAAFSTVHLGVKEAVEDLAEVDYLISDLANSLADTERDTNDLSGLVESKKNFQKSVQALKSRQLRQFDLVERLNLWGKSEQLSLLLQNVRKEYLAIKSALRVAYRQRGAMLCASDWQSPIYSGTIPSGANRLNEGIAEHSWDYKRDGHLDALAYEQLFVQEHASHLGSHLIRAYLANSGMAAFTTILHWLAHEVPSDGSALMLLPMYFENLHLVQAFFRNATGLISPSPEELLRYLQTEQPSVVFCDVVTNCGEVISHDIDTILHWAAEESNHKVAIVIDTTCLPTALLPSNILQQIPDNAQVILVESLAKHHQFGMDTVTGGIVIAHMKEDLHESFHKTRARLGTNITDTSVGSLPKPNHSNLVRRMQRHSRNTQLLADKLSTQTNHQDGAIASISWLRNGTKGLPWFHGTCLVVHLKEPFRSIDCYREFECRVLELAKAQNHLIGFSTSFGFDVARLYVTAPATPFEEPFLRISVGTETSTQINNLTEIIAQASSDLAQKTIAPHKNKPIGKKAFPESKQSPIARKEKSPEKLTLSRSVFLGEESLKSYLHPQNYPPTPLIELPANLNPFKGDGVRLLAKMMPLVPLMNIKSVPAFSMLLNASERGNLAGVEKIIESSSSNTVLSLSVIAKLFGIDSTCALVDHSIAPSLVRMLRLFGIEIFMHPGPGHKLYGKVPPRSERAKVYGSQQGWFNPGQYSNPDNPSGFEHWLAPDLWLQTQGRLAVLSCGLGTCGTMVGVSRGLRQRNRDIQVIACCPKPNEAIPGPRERAQLADVSFAWQEVANAAIELTAEESFAASIKLLRNGILGGPSSGMNYAGALRYLQQIKETKALDNHTETKGELWCVFLCCDSPLPHVDEYYDALGADYFPPVHAVSEEDSCNLVTPS